MPLDKSAGAAGASYAVLLADAQRSIRSPDPVRLDAGGDPFAAAAARTQRAVKRADGGRLPHLATAKARSFAGGGLASPVPGRTDRLPLDVPAGSYVVPADVVSGLGEGNSMAGIKTLDLMFKAGPYGTKAPKPVRGRAARPPGGMRMAKAPTPKIPKLKAKGFADGGAVPIIAAGGEYVIPPERVVSIGGGDVDRGHAILDAFVQQVRGDTIQTLSTLPGPAR